jgi:hypothetical protein
MTKQSMDDAGLMPSVQEWTAKAFGPQGTCHDCEEVRFDVTQYGGTQMMSPHCLKDANWSSLSFDQLDPESEVFESAKVASYVKGRGAWICLRLTLKKDGEPIIEEMFDREIVGTVPLDRPASAAQLIGELAVFPRTRENIPDWMIQTIEAAGEPVPVLDPESDMVVMGDESWPYEEPWL